MYIIRDKNAKAVLHIDHTREESNLDPKEVYEEFDPNTMEMGHYAGKKIPLYFMIDAEGQVQKMDKRKFRTARLAEESVSNGGQIAGNAVPSADPDSIELGMLETPKDMKLAQQRMDWAIETAIGEKITPGEELKRIKAFVEWIADGQPAKDERKKSYDDMQRQIQRVKTRFAKKKAVLATAESARKKS